jgi:hypothetical protein
MGNAISVYLSPPLFFFFFFSLSLSRCLIFLWTLNSTTAPLPNFPLRTSQARYYTRNPDPGDRLRQSQPMLCVAGAKQGRDAMARMAGQI